MAQVRQGGELLTRVWYTPRFVGPRLSRPARVLLMCVIVLLTRVTASAEPVELRLPFNLVVKAAPKWSAAVLVEPRWNVTPDAEMERVLFRPAIVYEPVSGLTIWAGYGFTEVHAGPDDQLLWQQVVYTFKAGRWTLAPRVRIEERFVERTDGVAWRLRAQLRAMHPLPHGTRWSFVAWHESFVPLNSVSGAQDAGFDEARFFAGLQRRLASHMTVEPGYLAMLNHGHGPLANDWAHAVSVTVHLRF